MVKRSTMERNMERSSSPAAVKCKSDGNSLSWFLAFMCTQCTPTRPTSTRNASRHTERRDMATAEHPAHYNQHPSGVECVDIAEAFNFNLGNVIKYVWRAGLKDSDGIDDLRKAKWYITREIERLEKANGS